MKTQGEADEEEGQEEEEDEEDDMSSYNSDDGENLEFEESKPSECDAVMWGKVMEIRERRLDLEELLVEVQKAVEVCILRVNHIINHIPGYSY